MREGARFWVGLPNYQAREQRESDHGGLRQRGDKRQSV